jgi:ABC-type antimicrobial peptide transport system permease subunit
MFWPMSANDFWEEIDFAQRTLVYVIRTDRAADPSFLPQVREAVWSLAPDVPIANVRMLDEVLAESMNRTSFTLIMLGIASAVALLIGAIGLYGVISYGVSQRTREIGVRMALGAQRSDVSGLFLRHAAVLSALGVGLGLVGAFFLTRSMSSLLFNVSPADPITYLLVSSVLVGVALLASYVPARRASAINPTRALHWE